MKKSLIAAAVLASASFGSWAADVGSTPQALGLVDNFTTFGDRFGAGNSGNTFADRFPFSVGDTVGQNLDATVASASRSADVGLDITGFSLFDTYGMMLGGLGILGFLARRRKGMRD
jgi:hypothetical protein